MEPRGRVYTGPSQHQCDRFLCLPGSTKLPQPPWGLAKLETAQLGSRTLCILAPDIVQTPLVAPVGRGAHRWTSCGQRMGLDTK